MDHPEESAILDLPPEAASVSCARQFVVDTLRGWNARAAEDDARLLTSEVVTNAVMYTDGTVTLCVHLQKDQVRIEVHDKVSGVPPVGTVSEVGAVSGRGLALVQALAARWGVEQITDDGKVVWFTVPSSQVTD